MKAIEQFVYLSHLILFLFSNCISEALAKEQCLPYSDEKSIIEPYVDRSLQRPTKSYILIFAGQNNPKYKRLISKVQKRDNLQDLLHIRLFCKDEPIEARLKNQSEFLKIKVILNGKLEENTTLPNPSTESLKNYLRKSIRSIVESHLRQVLNKFSFVQSNCKHNKTSNGTVEYASARPTGLIELKEENSKVAQTGDFKRYQSMSQIQQTQGGSRGMRFLWVSIIVLSSSILCFFLVKSSIDWATNSQTELNKIQDALSKDLAEEVGNNILNIRRHI